MSTFVDRLMEALAGPLARARAPEEDLTVDTGRFRALFMSGVRERAARGLLREPVASLAAWVRHGGLDDQLYDLADCLIEMGVVREQALLDRFLGGAVAERLGAAPELGPTDALLLEMAGRTVRVGAEEAPVRLFARRYARHLLLLRRPPEAAELTPLGDAVQRLPPELVLPFLVVLEGHCSYGSADPWRAPREAYEQLHERGEALLYRDESQRLRSDPRRLFRGHRLRRWVRMGLCDEVIDLLPECEYGVGLNTAGARALGEALSTPTGEVAGVCEELFRRSRKEVISGLWPTGPARAGEAGDPRDAVPAFVDPDLQSSGQFDAPRDLGPLREVRDTGFALKIPVAISATPISVTPTPISMTPTPISMTPTPISMTPTPISVTSTPISVTPTPISPPPSPAPGPLLTSVARDAAVNNHREPALPKPPPPPPLVAVAAPPEPPPAAAEPAAAASAAPAEPAAPPKGEPEMLDLEDLCHSALRDLQHNPRFAHLQSSLSVLSGTRKSQLNLLHSRLAVRLLLGQLLGTAALAVAGLPSPRLELELASQDDELVIWLHDNGPGIPISQRPLVFADPSRPGEALPRYQLGAVRRVVQEHLHGRIEIAAPRLGGASFRLSIPRHSQRQAA